MQEQKEQKVLKIKCKIKGLHKKWVFTQLNEVSCHCGFEMADLKKLYSRFKSL